MKKVLAITILALMFFSLIAVVSAFSFSFNLEAKSNADEKVENALSSSTFLGGITYYVFGVREITSENIEAEEYGLTSILIIFFLIWLILFLAFSDIIAMFSGFSAWVSWIIGFAITVIAANVKMVQIITIWAINITAIFGTISVFVGIIMAFVAFVALSLGTARLRNWALDRKMGIAAHRGQSEVAAGIHALRGVGSEITLGSKGALWWVILLVIGLIALALTIIGAFA